MLRQRLSEKRHARHNHHAAQRHHKGFVGYGVDEVSRYMETALMLESRRHKMKRAKKSAQKPVPEQESVLGALDEDLKLLSHAVENSDRYTMNLPFEPRSGIPSSYFIVLCVVWKSMYVKGDLRDGVDKADQARMSIDSLLQEAEVWFRYKHQQGSETEETEQKMAKIRSELLDNPSFRGTFRQAVNQLVQDVQWSLQQDIATRCKRAANKARYLWKVANEAFFDSQEEKNAMPVLWIPVFFGKYYAARWIESYNNCASPAQSMAMIMVRCLAQPEGSSTAAQSQLSSEYESTFAEDNISMGNNSRDWFVLPGHRLVDIVSKIGALIKGIKSGAEIAAHSPQKITNFYEHLFNWFDSGCAGPKSMHQQLLGIILPDVISREPLCYEQDAGYCVSINNVPVFTYPAPVNGRSLSSSYQTWMGLDSYGPTGLELMDGVECQKILHFAKMHSLELRRALKTKTLGYECADSESSIICEVDVNSGLASIVDGCWSLHLAKFNQAKRTLDAHKRAALEFDSLDTITPSHTAEDLLFDRGLKSIRTWESQRGAVMPSASLARAALIYTSRNAANTNKRKVDAFYNWVQETASYIPITKDSTDRVALVKRPGNDYHRLVGEHESIAWSYAFRLNYFAIHGHVFAPTADRSSIIVKLFSSGSATDDSYDEMQAHKTLFSIHSQDRFNLCKILHKGEKEAAKTGVPKPAPAFLYMGLLKQQGQKQEHKLAVLDHWHFKIEMQAYTHLEDLQGSVLPRLYWHGTNVSPTVAPPSHTPKSESTSMLSDVSVSTPTESPNIAPGPFLVLEDVGSQHPDWTSAEHREAALQSLHQVHERGMFYGESSLRRSNMRIRPDGTVVFLSWMRSGKLTHFQTMMRDREHRILASLFTVHHPTAGVPKRLHNFASSAITC